MEDGLPVKKGTIIEIDTEEGDWCWCKHQQKMGYVPTSYIKKLANSQVQENLEVPKYGRMSYMDMQQRKPREIDVVNTKPVFAEERSNELDALLKRKQKVAEVLVPTPVHLIEGSVFGSERGCHSPGPEIDRHSASQKNAGRHQQGDCRIEEGLLL
ncbi:hypothetical protein BLSTO_04411 [Blastocystis sp. subtype 1]